MSFKAYGGTATPSDEPGLTANNETHDKPSPIVGLRKAAPPSLHHGKRSLKPSNTLTRSRTMISTLTLPLLAVAGGLAAAAPQEPDVALVDILRPDQVCSITVDWAAPGAPDGGIVMIETVRPAEAGAGPIWRALHHAANPVADAAEIPLGFDSTEVLRADLRLLNGESRWGGNKVRFEYSDDQARRIDASGEAVETIALDGTRPLPWYPGSAILNQAVPWRDGLRATGHLLDNYLATGDARLRPLAVEVTGR